MKSTITHGIAVFAFALILFGVTNNSVAQSLVTDQTDYTPGSVATLLGSGFISAEVVTLQVTKTDGTDDQNTDYIPWTVTADTTGSFATTWPVPVNEEFVDPTVKASADGISSGEHAETTFKAEHGGTGVVTVTADNGSCLGYTPAQGNGPDNWEVAEGGSYTVTISGVTECSGDAITVFVQNSENGNWCFNATGGNGTYVGSITFPNPSCFTSPISYKCGADQECSNANTVNANGPSGTGSVHFRASTFDADCNKTGDDEDCSATTCSCTVPANIIITSIENDQVQVCWDAQDCASGYILQYQWKGHSNWITVDVTAPDHCTIIDLKSHTNIYVKVATVCSTGDTTDYSYTANYKYSAACIVPVNQSTTDITSTSATLNWTPGTASGQQRVRYQIVGQTASTVVNVSKDATSLTVNNLTPSTQYKWKVKGDCWSSYLKFTTAGQKLGGLTSEGSVNKLSVYPNPATDNLYVNIKMNDSKDHSATLQILNTMGQIVYTQDATIANGNSTINVALNSQLTDGVYVLRVVANNQMMEQRIVISNDK